MDLVEFLNARLDELARVGEQGAIQPGLGDEVPVSVLDYDYRLTVDPAWLLADVAAKRIIITEFEECRDEAPVGDRSTGYLEALYRVIRTMGVVFADHPEYREEWRV